MKDSYSHILHRAIFYLIIAMVGLNIQASCDEYDTDNDLNVSEAMAYFKENSAVDGASFYMKNRETYPFLDTLYLDSIYPVIASLDYYTMKDVCNIIRNTEAEEVLRINLEEARKPLLGKLKEEILKNEEKEKRIFENNTLEFIRLGLDSMIHADVEDVVDNYNGWFGWKNIKHYILSDEKEDFMKLWKKYIVVEKYNAYIRQASNEFLTELYDTKKEFIRDVTGLASNQKDSVDFKPWVFALSDSTMRNVEKYTSGEMYDMTIATLKDYVIPFAITMASGGTATTFYELAVTGYDVKVTYDEVKNEKPTESEILLYKCESEISRMIDENILEQYRNGVLLKIEDINKKTINYIDYLL